jgi:preprotein translocase subunit YajC
MMTLISAFPVLMAAPAGEGGSSTGSMMTTFITFGLIILVFYFLIIRPQKKKEKETKSMISAVQKGDKVVTIGGIRGTVVAVREDSVTVKVDDNAKIEFSKGAISSVVNKKEAKAAEAKTEAVSEPAPAKKKAAPKKKAAVKKPETAKKAADTVEQNEIKNKKEEKSGANSEKTE